MCEIESILNQRPLSPVSAESVELGPLTPSHLLMTKSVYSDIAGAFDERDVYVRRRWRYVQYLADLFWIRWKKEYIRILLQRNKWVRNEQEIKKGDLVVVI